MFSKKKDISQIDTEQRELFEHARKRIIQKKRLFQHFVFFVIGSAFVALLNLVLGFGKDITLFNRDWFVFVILIWALLVVIHFCNVWLFHKFMGQEWTDRQMERLVAKQKLEISKIQQEVDLMHPKEELLKKKEEQQSQLNPDQKIKPNNPEL